MNHRPLGTNHVLFFFGLCVAANACGTSPTGNLALGSSTGAMAQAGAYPADMLTAGTAGKSNVSATGGNRFASTASTDVLIDPNASAKYRACMVYTRAQCQRRFVDCGERSSMEDPCSSSLDRCPDLLFSAGSTWTVDSLNSCTEAWKAFSCEEIRQNERPACAQVRGTRQLDAPCLFASQCSSGACTKLKKDGTGVAGFDSCQVCGVQSALGEPCGIAGYECAPELACGATGACEAKALRGVIGTACNDNSTCGGSGISCRADPTDAAKRCLVFPGVGQACTDDFLCADGAFCQGKLCVTAPTLGQTCGTKGSAQCAAGLVCSSHFDVESYVCIQPRKLGEVCQGDVRRAPRGNCELGLRCDCGELDCDLKSGVCRHGRAEGDACGDSNSVCLPGTSCTNGICTAIGAQPAILNLCPQ